MTDGKGLQTFGLFCLSCCIDGLQAERSLQLADLICDLEPASKQLDEFFIDGVDLLAKRSQVCDVHTSRVAAGRALAVYSTLAALMPAEAGVALRCDCMRSNVRANPDRGGR